MAFSVFHREGGCGIVRGVQVAEFLNAKDNPESGYENDTCIYVKLKPEKYPKHSYHDFVDGAYNLEWMKAHPDMGVIAVSELSQEYLSMMLNRKDVIFIPHHHCNYERFVRPDRPVKVVGIIGSQNSFQYPREQLEKQLNDLGLELRYDFEFWKTYNNTPAVNGATGREKVCNFYKGIDLQIVWRVKPWSPRFDVYRNPLKLENAGSFGIPTISYPEPSYVREWGDNFLQAHSIGEMMDMVKMLRDYPLVYKNMANKAIVKAETYHKDHIKELYLKL